MTPATVAANERETLFDVTRFAVTPNVEFNSDDEGAQPQTVRPADLRAERAAQHVGLAPTAIERLPFDLSVLNDGGILLDVDTRNFGVLDRRLDWQALGITLPKGTDLSFRPPRCGLVPDRYRLPLLRPAAQAHAALHRYSYHFRLVETVLESSSYRWVPWRAWPAFEQAFNQTHSHLNAALDAYDANFGRIQDTVLATFSELAEDSIRRLAATGHPVPDDFVGVLVRGVHEALPKPDTLRAQLSLRYRVGVLQLGSELLGEQRRAAEERQRLQAVDADWRLEQQRQDIQRRVLQEGLWSEQERLRMQRAAEEDDRRREAAIKEQLRQLKLQAARERLESTLSPLQEGAQQLRAVVYDAATTLRSSLEKNQALRGSSARKARDLCKWFRLMDWTGDENLEVLVRELEQLATAPIARARKRDPKPLESVLRDIVALTYSDARAIVEPNRMAGLEL